MIPTLRKFNVERQYIANTEIVVGFGGDVGIRKGHAAGKAILGSFNYFVA